MFLNAIAIVRFHSVVVGMPALHAAMDLILRRTIYLAPARGSLWQHLLLTQSPIWDHFVLISAFSVVGLLCLCIYINTCVYFLCVCASFVSLCLNRSQLASQLLEIVQVYGIFLKVHFFKICIHRLFKRQERMGELNIRSTVDHI